MDKEQAKRIIKDTFEASFNEGKFISFIMNLLNLKQSDIENTSFGIRQGYNIPEMFRPYISRFQRIAKYLKDDNRIDVLIVDLKKETSIERARSRQRNFIAGYLKGNYGSDKPKDVALVAFVSPNKADWRFSLVKMDYRFEEGKSGKIKVREEFTPVKRWSFLVGKNESSHTAQSRLVHILADDQYNPTLAQLEEAFNIEKVTKEFFLKYRNLFLRIKEELDKVVEDDPKVKKDFAEKGVDTVNFAKKFLGQILFLYFLQKKGWFGVERDGEWGTGPKDFLRQLFNKEYGNYKNFFNDILEPLFYEALARERDNDFYSRFNCKIPFLNGGLFEPIGGYDWVHTDINLSNELFVNRNDNYEGNGVLDIFDLFNFTVKEDEPLEKEVAIDPELLGKTYEKFNAIRPDNYQEYKKALKSGRKGEENKFNKKFGVYYTPREIVHYMCQESLINYLHTVVNQKLMKQPARAPRQIKLIGSEDPEQLGFHTEEEIVDKKTIEELIKFGEQFTENEQVVEEKKKETNTYKYQLLPGIRKNAKVIDEKLKAIRVCDPAVGSGAFPVGMMAEIVKVRNVLSVHIKEQNRTPYNFKRECIEKSLYGVDIDLGAVEIAKLRLWLSLIVDEEDIKNIKPLPNLDYKIMQGNSLISEFMGIDLDNGKQNNNENVKLFFIDKTKELYEKLKIKKDKLLNQTNANKKKILKNEIENLIIKIFEIKLQEQKANYFRKIRKIEEKYERHPVKEEREREIKREKDMLSIRTGFNLEEVEKQLRQYTSNQKVRPFFPWKLYFSEVFQEKDGFDVIIANPPYVRADNPDIKEQRKAIMNSKNFQTLWEKWDFYVVFIEKGYELLTYNGILEFIIPNAYMSSKYAEKSHEYFLQNATISRIDFCSDLKIFEAAVRNIIIEFKKRINTKHIPLRIRHKEKWDNFIILPSKSQFEMGKNTFKFDSENKTIGDLSNTLTWGEICYVSYGVAQSSDEKKYKGEFIKEDVLSDIQDDIHPLGYIEGKYIESYVIRQVRYIEWGTKRSPKKWRRITFPELYKPEKIMLGGMTGAIIDEKGLLCNHSMTVSVLWKNLAYVNNRSIEGSIKKDFHIKSASVFRKRLEENSELFNLKYLLAILNSKFAYNFLDSVRRSQIGFYPDDLKKLPIKKIPLPEQQTFIIIVDKILSLTQSSDYYENLQKQVKVKECERQIDQMVYKLYDLTEEEIKIVEGKNKTEGYYE